MKIKAEDLWPLILNFIEEYFGEEDLAHFKEHFDLKIGKINKDPLVKAGGIKAILADYFKHNKPVYKKFRKAVGASDTPDLAGKRKRAQSNDSEASEPPKKRQRTSSVASDKSEPKKRQRASSVNSEEKSEPKKAPLAVPPKDLAPVPFSRINAAKF